MKKPWQERFDEKWIEEPISGCSIWIASTKQNGYGQFSLNGRAQPAHRLAYMRHYGAIPDTFVLDHLCRRPSCVNPYHLEAVPHRENCRRGAQARPWTHCQQGHAIIDGNIFYEKTRRRCLTCYRKRINWKGYIGRGTHHRMKTHCKRGHALHGANVLLRKDRNNGRECRQCDRIRHQQNAQKRKRAQKSVQ